VADRFPSVATADHLGRFVERRDKPGSVDGEYPVLDRVENGIGVVAGNPACTMVCLVFQPDSHAALRHPQRRNQPVALSCFLEA
jgi:hypothetical protein